jgi:AraC family transcriptional regulator
MDFYWRLLREQKTSAFRLTEQVVRRDAEMPWHCHSTAYISFLLAGSYAEQTRATDHSCSTGTVIWHAAGETHRDRFSQQGGHLLSIEFRDEWLRNTETAAKVELTNVPHFSYGGPRYSLGLSLYHFLNTGREAPEDLAIELLSLYARHRDGSRQPDWFARVLELIHDAHDEQLSLSTVARVAGVHSVHVSRSFRRWLGCTFTEYLGQVRLRRALDLLQGSRRPVVDVAIESGFADHAHLCRSFKRGTGTTPSAYRTHLQG